MPERKQSPGQPTSGSRPTIEELRARATETPDEVQAALEANPNAYEDTEFYERGGEVIFVDRLAADDEEA